MVIPSTAPGRVLYALRRAHQAVEVAKDERLRPTGVTPALYAALINIHQHPGVTGAELARLLGVTPQNVTGLVARLTERGLVERVSHDRHAHVLEIRLTDDGRARLALADRAVGDLEDAAVAHLGAADAGRLRELLELLAEGVITSSARTRPHPAGNAPSG